MTEIWRALPNPALAGSISGFGFGAVVAA